MKFTDLFIKRPILALVVNLLILIAGLVSIETLSVRQYPRSDIAEVTIKTAYVGANADLVRGFITTPLSWWKTWNAICRRAGLRLKPRSLAPGSSWRRSFR